jgi:hypothetical protein
MNIERLKAVRQAILKHKERFNYNYWVRHNNNIYKTFCPETLIQDSDNHTCNTVGCVAGFTCALFAPKEVEAIHETAKATLGLTHSQSGFLFLGNAGLGFEHVSPDSDDATAEEAIARIDALIAYQKRKDRALYDQSQGD